MWYAILLAGAIGLDQLLKWWVTSHLEVGQSAPLLPGVVQLTRLHNTGAAWSSFSGKTGLLAAVTVVLLAAVVLWFVCVTDVITSDKVVYLFGRVIPALSLLLSMTLRFVPQFTRRLRTVAQAQRRLGRDAGRGSVRRRLREAMRVFSIVVTWSLESGLIAADSMRGRGYGLPGRTAFALYRLDRRDAAMLLWLGFCGLYLLDGGLAGGLAFQYYPLLSAGAVTPLTVSFFAVYGLLCFTPALVDGASRRLYLTRKGGDHHA